MRRACAASVGIPCVEETERGGENIRRRGQEQSVDGRESEILDERREKVSERLARD